MDVMRICASLFYDITNPKCIINGAYMNNDDASYFN